MCPHDVDPMKELSKVPGLIREAGWSCSDFKGDDESYTGNHRNLIVGASGPEDNAGGIRCFTGIAFNVEAREEDLKVRIAWPGQFSTTFSCWSAEQVVFWLGKMIGVAEKDMKDREKSGF